MIVWTVANQKGGVGKTTTVVSLGGQLSRLGQRTLLIDMDAHGSMTSYFRFNPDKIKNSLYQIFAGERSNKMIPERFITATRFSDLWLLPASTALATLDRQLGGVNGMGLVISQVLRKLSVHFDFALIDCPPQLGVLMVNALAACNHLIIPVQTEFLALKGLERMQVTMAAVAKTRGKQLDYTIVPTMFDQRTRASVSTLKTLRARYSPYVWSSVIPIDTQFRDTSRLGIPLPLKKPRAHGSLAYRQLLDDLLCPAALPQQQVMPTI